MHPIADKNPECDKYLFWQNTNTAYYSVFRNHSIPNIEYYLVLTKSEYWIVNTVPYYEYPYTKYKWYYSVQYSNTEY